MITKDNVTIDIDAVLYYRVADPQKATYAVQNLPYALETLTRTTLRNIVGEMELDATLASRDAINTRMREVIEEAAIGWGVDLTRVELQAIEPPRDIKQSMELQMRAERERRAAVTNAEATKRAAILESEGVREAQVRRAEGEKDAAILRAQGLATARLAMAEAEAQALERIAAALPEGEAAMYLLGIKYLEALPKMTEGSGTTIFLPAEATGVMGAIGGLRELLVRGAPSGTPQPAATARHRAPVAAPARPRRRSSAAAHRRAAERDRTVPTAATRTAIPWRTSERGADHPRASRADRACARMRELRRVQLQEARGQTGVGRPAGGAWRRLDRHEGLRRLRRASGARDRRGRGRGVRGQ